MTPTPQEVRLDVLAALRAVARGDQQAYDVVVHSSDDPAAMLLTSLRLCRLLIVEHFGEDNVDPLLDRLVAEEYATEQST